MKLSRLFSEDGALDYKGDTYHPATPQGAPTKAVPGSGVDGAGIDMSPKEDDKPLSQRKFKKRKKLSS